MKKFFFTIFAFALIALSGNAETKTATFDFSSNNYNFPECPDISDSSNGDLAISNGDAGYEITDKGISIILAPQPYKKSTGNYYTMWRSDIKVLFYDTFSHFVIKTNEVGSIITQVIITFANEKNGGTGYFFDTWSPSKKKAVGSYSLSNDVGTLDLSNETYSEIHWLCNQAATELHIKKIEVSYSLDTSALSNISNDVNKVIASNGAIRVEGEYKSIQVFNISGSMISQGKSTINCQPGIYIVKVDGKAKKVIVR